MNNSIVTFCNNYESPINTICVCGAARSGTSMVSGILRLLDVDMGEGFLDPDTNEDNRYLTHDGVRKIFDNVESKAHYIDTIASLSSEHNAKGLSGWKDPLSSYYIGDIRDTIDGLGVIFVARDPVSIALGELRFRESTASVADFGSFIGNIDFINNEYKAIANFLTNFDGKCLFVSYEKALRHKELFLSDISEFTGIDIDDRMKEKLSKYISPEVSSGSISS